MYGVRAPQVVTCGYGVLFTATNNSVQACQLDQKQNRYKTLIFWLK